MLINNIFWLGLIFLSACTTRYPQVEVKGLMQSGQAISVGLYRAIDTLNQYIEESYEYVYLTKDHDSLVTASSLYLVPKHAKKQMVVFAHPTTGISSDCGVNNGLYQWMISEFISSLLKQKYIVVLPNYRGLGISNTRHKFLNADEAAMDVLDAIKAAISLFKLPANIPIVLWGYSQGGQATQRASEIANQYAPDLHIIGSIQNSAPLLLSSAWEDVLAKRINLSHYLTLPYVLSGAVRSHMGISYSDFSSQRIVNDDNLNICAIYTPLLLVVSNPLINFKKIDQDKLSRMLVYLKQQDIGKGSTDIPLLIIRGKADKIVKPAWQEKVLNLLCKQNMKVFELVREGEHFDLKDISIALQWIHDRFALKNPPNSCSQH